MNLILDSLLLRIIGLKKARIYINGELKITEQYLEIISTGSSLC